MEEIKRADTQNQGTKPYSQKFFSEKSEQQFLECFESKSID